MKALTWQGKRKVSVETVPDPKIEAANDAIIEVTSTAICGSDLHLYEVLGPFMEPGDVIGHEPMGRVVEAGPSSNLSEGDRVVVPFTIACGSCWMCDRGLYSQCETTQVKEYGSGAKLFGYSKLYGSVPGAQAEYLRVPHADFGPIKVGEDLPDHRYLFLSDVLPTAWQAVQYAQVGEGDCLAVFGLGPIGQMCARIGRHLGARVFGVDPVPERRAMAARHGARVFDYTDETNDAIRDATDGRGPDGVVDAVGMEAHGSPLGKASHHAVGLLPDALSGPLMEKPAWTAWPRCTPRSTWSAAAAPSQSAASTAARPTPCRCSPSSTSRFSYAPGNATSKPGLTTSCRWWRTPPTHWASTTWSPTACRWIRRRAPTRCSRRKRTAASKSS